MSTLTTRKIVLISGASSGFGALTARTLADAGDTVVYAGMRDTEGRNAPQVQAAADYSTEHGADLRAIELDVNLQDSVDAAARQIHDEQGRIDVLIHNAGHMVVGPTEAFTPEQLAELYDTNVLSTQRLNRAVLPRMRQRGDGLLIWVSSTSVKGGTPPYLAPYFAAKAGMEPLCRRPMPTPAWSRTRSRTSSPCRRESARTVSTSIRPMTARRKFPRWQTGSAQSSSPESTSPTS